MLSSRYLHLHEALDLGPMWLQQGAHIASETSADAVRAETESESHNIATAANQTGFQTASDMPPDTAARAAHNIRPSAQHKGEITSAHAAVMAAVGRRSTLQQRQTAADSGETDVAAPSENSHIAVPRLHSPVSAARLLVVSICPSPEDLAAGRLFSGADGQMLDNMLSAIGITLSENCRQSWLEHLAFQPSAEEMQAQSARLQTAVRQSGAHAVLLLGRFFAQAELMPLLQQTFGSLPLFAVPHPARLLSQPQLKAQAWAELKKLRAILAG